MGRDRPGRGQGAERAHARVAIDAFVRLVGADREYVFRTRDLSEGGLFLTTRVGHLYPLELGSDVAIELHEEDVVVELHGVVVRVVALGSPEAERSPPGFGVRLNPLSPKERSVLLDLIDRRREG
jgi:hypothetical protein